MVRIDGTVDNYSEYNICCVRFEDGNYERPEKLDPAINESGTINYSPFSPPDRSVFAVFTPGTSWKPQPAFHKLPEQDDTWTTSKNIIGTDGA